MRSALLLLALVLTACSGDPGSTTTSDVNPKASLPYMGGTIVLSGRLAEATQGAIHVVVTAPTLATPFVVKCPIGKGTLTQDGKREVPFSLHGWSGMLATEIPLETVPDELELKASFTPSGYVEQIERWQDVVLPIRKGQLDARVVMEPREAPASRPTSRPTGHPAGG